MPNEIPDPGYIPILKAKQGELEALKQSSPEERRLVLPLLEVPPVPVKWLEGEDDPVPAKTIDQHIPSTAEKIFGSLKEFDRVLIDGKYIEEDAALATGEEPIAAVLRLLGDRGLHVVPVVGLGACRLTGGGAGNFPEGAGLKAPRGDRRF